MVTLDQERNGMWDEFKAFCDLTLEKVVPRLLEPLQSEGRSIKPCLIHGDLWDENTATDMDTGEPFVFDAGSMYGMMTFLNEAKDMSTQLTDAKRITNTKLAIGEPHGIA